MALPDGFIVLEPLPVVPLVPLPLVPIPVVPELLVPLDPEPIELPEPIEPELPIPAELPPAAPPADPPPAPPAPPPPAANAIEEPSARTEANAIVVSFMLFSLVGHRAEITSLACPTFLLGRSKNFPQRKAKRIASNFRLRNEYRELAGQSEG